jgi:dinuclear metal center YbgI/SA1388 family protein
MSIALGQLIEQFETRWPLANAESWDAPGLVTGSRPQQVHNVLLTVDVTAAVVAEAIEGGVNLILAHHPFLMRAVTGLGEESAKGGVITSLIKNNIALYSAHTNADGSATGTSATLADKLGVKSLASFDSNASLTENSSGRIGSVANRTLGQVAATLAELLPHTASSVRVAGEFDQQISRVALAAGAGDSFADAAYQLGADLFISSDLRHHVVLELLERARAEGKAFSVIDISHWAAEWLWLEVAASELASANPEVNFKVCDVRTDVWDFVINPATPANSLA